MRDTPYALRTYLQTYDNTVSKYVPLELFPDQIFFLTVFLLLIFFPFLNSGSYYFNLIPIDLNDNQLGNSPLDALGALAGPGLGL